MPIKLPKSFARRKSSGNILEDVEAQPQSSFRVFERPSAERSMSDGAPLSKRFSEGNVVPSALEDSDNIFAGTEQPLGKIRGATNYESSTSTRLSSSSTQPSSTEIASPEDASPHSRMHDIPVPPPIAAGGLRAAAGRTFSFGARFKSSAPAPPRHATPDQSTRQRAVSGTTDETATPPKLTDEEFSLGGDDFGKMFDHLGKRESVLMRDPSPQPANKLASTPPTQALPDFYNTSRAARPPPIDIDRSAPVEPPPHSWNSRHSEEGLLNSPGENDIYSPAQSTPETVTGFRRQSPAPNQMLGATTSHRALDRPKRQSDMGLRRSIMYYGDRDSTAIDDEDAAMVKSSLMWSKESGSPPRQTGGISPSGSTPLLKNGHAGNSASNSAQVSPEPESMFSNIQSPAINDHMENARLAVQFAESLPKSVSPGNKVMTPSQFEHYRQQQELRRSNSDASDSEDNSDHDDFDEQDEAEKQREAALQRRKQEAHLSVYRQQMMKVTGQQAPSPSLRPVMSGASSSTPNLPVFLNSTGDKSSSGKSHEGGDDEDVPLGILAAHGFPNRNRPPTRLANASSNPNLRASINPYASSSSSLVGVEQDQRGSLPVFARNLPRDPYFGASLVNSTNRESLAMGGGSVYGGPASSPGPPGGLIGVIAQEEQARAMRRGSPNTQAMYDMGAVPRPFSMMPPPPPQQAMTPGEQAQAQLTAQMSEMMNMQMEWMQKMMAMQGMHGPPPPMMQGGMATPPMMGGGPMPGAPMGPPSMAGPMMVGPMMTGPPSISGHSNMRPVSMPGLTPNAPNFDQRTLSMIDPNIAMRRTGSPMPNLSGGSYQQHSPGYAPSIAPSERSNAGLSSRYRPVSALPGDLNHHASPLHKSWNDENRPNAHLPMSKSTGSIPKSISIATVTVRPESQSSQAGPGIRKVQNASDDEDDDEAWADMMKKRDKKKSSWKLKRGTSSFGDLLSVVH
ncbi:uncharacterized protein N7484_001802 [Penicillium longicatenatum]|uniref:uncharacterized protein n=1 Tax=Penicillium longicatenatum TaxID=1561947 RepID=UPI0025477DC5|nr:uncharacterized protein N7484_001802 [Penicillium longicatenatum]KAJ5658153.1 hypothetical protein N7484_001802 [Penicillium longicatenatum]